MASKADRGLDLDIQLEPIALSKAQVEEHNLPCTPIKRSELRRKSFIEAHGAGAVELDALEALHPGEFEKRIAGVQERLGELHPQIKVALNQVDVDIADYPLPDPKAAEEFEHPLYNSERDYLDQLKQYKIHQHGGSQ